MNGFFTHFEIIYGDRIEQAILVPLTYTNFPIDIVIVILHELHIVLQRTGNYNLQRAWFLDTVIHLPIGIKKLSMST